MACLRRLVLVAAALCAALSVVHAERQARVVEGTPADIEKAPWLVQVVYSDEKGLSDVNTCAGSIVGKRKVLTAAHCFTPGTLYDKHPDEYMAVLAGATGKVDEKGGRLYNIESVVKHPKFLNGKEMNQAYDLAIITVDEDFEFNDKVQSIEIAKKKVKANRGKAVGGGWGVRSDKAEPVPESFAPTLITAEQVVLPPEFCKQYFAGTDLHKEAQASLLCTKPIDGMPCNGDSGSGLWVPATKKSGPQLFGVLQGGIVCDVQKGIPFYVDIQHDNVREFLQSNGVLSA